MTRFVKEVTRCTVNWVLKTWYVVRSTPGYTVGVSAKELDDLSDNSEHDVDAEFVLDAASPLPLPSPQSSRASHVAETDEDPDDMR
jgi:hypothetical protein